jgi:predicted  nucleic acid-binding Zn-ribbon protein
MTTPQKISEGQRRQMVAEAAYFRAERRGFDGDGLLADWLEAEAEVEARLRESEGEPLLERLEERLAAANEKLRTFKKKLAGMKSDAREEWEHDVERLAKLRDSFQEGLNEIREQGHHASEKAKQRAEKTWAEISEVIERVSSRRKGRHAR